MAEHHPTIAILYIALGRYDCFWDRFRRSMDEHFLPGWRKHYLIFSDHDAERFGNRDVTVLRQRRRGWPYDTLLRYHFFTEAEARIARFDYVFFCNANMVAVAPVGPEIFPAGDTGLTMTVHDSFFAKDRLWFPYERRMSSTAVVPFWKGRRYYAGGFNGGNSSAFLDMSHQLARNIDMDFKRGIIARWHDESHLNAYVVDRPVHELHPGYMHQEKRRLPFPSKLKVLDKEDFGGIRNLRQMPKRQRLSEMSISPQGLAIEVFKRLPAAWRRTVMPPMEPFRMPEAVMDEPRPQRRRA